MVGRPTSSGMPRACIQPPMASTEKLPPSGLQAGKVCSPGITRAPMWNASTYRGMMVSGLV